MATPAARRVAAMLAATAATGALYGCTGGPADPTVTSTHASSAAADVTPRAVALAALQPCDLLDAGQKGRLRYDAGSSFAVGRTRACTHTTADGAATLTVSLVTDSGIRALRPPVTDTTTSHVVGVHKAIRIEAGDAPRCTLVLDVQDRDSVSVQAVLGSARDACEHVMDVAASIEPLLP